MAAGRAATYAGYGRKAYGRYPGREEKSRSGQAYVYGNTVRKPEVLPPYVPVHKPEQKKEASRQVRKNRKRALNMNAAYALFMTGAAICAVVICFFYLRLQSETVSRSENITALQKELVELTEENDTARQAAEDSVNLGNVRDKAVNELGMVYASQGRVVPYESPAGDSVKQYSDIPENGVLAKSGSLTE